MKTNMKVIGVVAILVISIFFGTSAFAVTSKVQPIFNGSFVFMVYGQNNQWVGAYLFDAKTGALRYEAVNKAALIKSKVSIQTFEFGNLYKVVKFINKDGSLGALLDIRLHYNEDGSFQRTTMMGMLFDAKGNVLHKITVVDAFNASGKLIDHKVTDTSIKYDANGRAISSIEKVYSSIDMKPGSLISVTVTQCTKYDSLGRVIEIISCTYADAAMTKLLDYKGITNCYDSAIKNNKITSDIQHLPNGSLVLTVYGSRDEIAAAYMFDKTGKLVKEGINQGVVKTQVFEFGNLYKSIRFINKDGSLGARLSITTRYNPDGSFERKTTMDTLSDSKGNLIHRLEMIDEFSASGKLLYRQVSDISTEYDANGRAIRSVEKTYSSIDMKPGDLTGVTVTEYTKYDSLGRVIETRSTRYSDEAMTNVLSVTVTTDCYEGAVRNSKRRTDIQHLPNGSLVFSVYGANEEIAAAYMFDGKTGKLIKEGINKGVVKVQESGFGNLYRSVKFLNEDGSIGARLDIRSSYNQDGSYERTTTLGMYYGANGKPAWKIVIADVFDASGKLLNREVRDTSIEYDANGRPTHSIEYVYNSLAMKDSDLMYIVDTRYTKYDDQGRLLQSVSLKKDSNGRPILQQTETIDTDSYLGEMPAGLAIQGVSGSPIPSGITMVGAIAEEKNKVKPYNQ